MTTIQLSEFNTNQILNDFLVTFIKFNIIEEKIENIHMAKTDGNKVMLSNFYELYKSNLFIDENKILFDIIPTLLTFLHNNKNSTNNLNYWNLLNLKKQLNLLLIIILFAS